MPFFMLVSSKIHMKLLFSYLIAQSFQENPKHIMNPIDDFIATLEPNLQELANILRHYILASSPDIKEKIAYGIPFFFQTKNICYINPTKEGLDLAFVKGHMLNSCADPFELKGRKNVKSIYLQSSTELDFEILDQVLQEAIQLDLKKQ